MKKPLFEINKEVAQLATKLGNELIKKLETLNLQDKLTEPETKRKIAEFNNFLEAFRVDAMVNGFNKDIEVFKSEYSTLSKIIEEL